MIKLLFASSAVWVLSTCLEVVGAENPPLNTQAHPNFDGGDPNPAPSLVECDCSTAKYELDDCANTGYIYELLSDKVEINVGGTSTFVYKVTKCDPVRGQQSFRHVDVVPLSCNGDVVEVDSDGTCELEKQSDTPRTLTYSHHHDGPAFDNEDRKCADGISLAKCYNIDTLEPGQSVLLAFSATGVTGIGPANLFVAPENWYASCTQRCILGPSCSAVGISNVDVTCANPTKDSTLLVSFSVVEGVAPYQATVTCGKSYKTMKLSKNDAAITIGPCSQDIEITVADSSKCPEATATYPAKEIPTCWQPNSQCKQATCILPQDTEELSGCNIDGVPEAFTDVTDVFSFKGYCDTSKLALTYKDTYSGDQRKASSYCGGLTVTREYQVFQNRQKLGTCKQFWTITQDELPVFTKSCSKEFPTITLGCSSSSIPPPATCSFTTACSNRFYTAVYNCCAQNGQLLRTWTATDICGNIATKSQVVKISDKTCGRK